MDLKQSFPEECFEDIFRHLSGKELLKCTLVAPKWSTFIGSSRSCLKKISLRVVNEFNNLDDIEKILKRSIRKYTRLTLQGDYSRRVENILLMNKGTWEHIICLNSRFETINDVLNCLRIVQSTVEVLDLGNTILSKKHKLAAKSQALQFPNLKILDISCDLAVHFDRLFVNCRNLESLKVKVHDQKTPSSALSAIRTSLGVNKQLKKLELSGRLLFNDDFLTTATFKLTEFEFILPSGSFPIRQNLNLFLMAQSGTLEVLVIHEWAGVDVMKTILSMPHLKEFFLSRLPTDPSENEAFDLPQNHSVTSLYLSHYPNLKTDGLKHFLKAFPKVESLKVLIMCDEVIDLIPDTCKSLRRLWVNRFQAGNVRESNEAFYMNLDEFKCKHPYGPNNLFFRLNGTVDSTIFNNPF